MTDKGRTRDPRKAGPDLGDRPAGVVIRPHHKGFPAWMVGRPVSQLSGMHLGPSGLTTPVLLLHSDELDHNIRTLQQFCDEAGLSLAPHVKTTMSPEIIGRQLDAGAWAVTVATSAQARTVLQTTEAKRVLIANELVDPDAIYWLARRLEEDDDLEVYCYVDSLDGLHILERALADRLPSRPLSVLIEWGFAGGRGGVRKDSDFSQLVEVLRASESVRLAGVAGFEGLVGSGMGPERLNQVRQYLASLKRVADHAFESGATKKCEFIVTAGGSTFAEVVADTFDQTWRAGRSIRVVLRSGCYVTHDSGVYQHRRSLLAAEIDVVDFKPALELWGRVLSRPENDLAILDFGRRDTGTDVGLPVPLRLLHQGDQRPQPAPSWSVVALNDQHTYLRADHSSVSAGSLDVQVGDLVGFGISHPCTTLDKWSLIPVVDSDRTVLSVARTLL